MSEESIKKVLRIMPYGFYAVTSRSGDDQNAMVANWIMQVSFTPRLIAFALAKNAHTRTLIDKSQTFVINIFSKDDQEAIMGYTKSRAKNPEKLVGVKTTVATETLIPVLPGASAYLEVSVTSIHDVGGDHDIVIGEVVGADILKEISEKEALTLPHIGWSYAG